MSTIIMGACWPLGPMSPSQKAVLISLADQANDDGVCWPSVGTIAKRTCLSERAVQDALAWLQTAGALLREYRANTSTSYTVTPARFKPSKAPARQRKASTMGANGAPPADSAPGEANAPPANGAPGANGAPPPAAAAPRGADGAPPEVQMAHPNHQVNHHSTVNEPLHPAAPSAPSTETALQAACRETWRAYVDAYTLRYGAAPVRNAQVNTKVKQFVQLIGFDESPAVARFYVERVNEAFVVRQVHDLGLLVKGSAGYRTQWATNTTMTNTRARQADQSQANCDVADEAMAILRAQREQRGNGAADAR